MIGVFSLNHDFRKEDYYYYFKLGAKLMTLVTHSESLKTDSVI